MKLYGSRVRKPSKEKRWDSRLERLAQTARLTIRDNGIGFSIGSETVLRLQSSRQKAREGAPRSLGLTLMEAMISQIDGIHIINYDEGTSVVLEYPLL